MLQTGKIVSVIFNDDNYVDKVELNLGDYEIIEEHGKTYAVKKKKEYPKTLGECRAILGIMSEYGAFHYKTELITTFMSLLICRDAYWKIAGDWKPDYDSGVDKFGICTYDGVVQKSNAASHWERHLNKVLEFPTKEMRDAFYENFKDLIEECKELL